MIHSEEDHHCSDDTSEEVDCTSEHEEYLKDTQQMLDTL